jgi:hypothetical protein
MVLPLCKCLLSAVAVAVAVLRGLVAAVQVVWFIRLLFQ